MLVDKTVLITGASSGIGQACARAFAAAGSRLVLAARRRDRLDALASELDTEVLPLALDVRDRAAVEAAVEGLPEEWAAIDVLVNNAGLAAGWGPVVENDPSDWDRMIDTNVRGLFDVTRVVARGMVARGSGHVINVGSIAGLMPYANGAVYCATKAAVDAFTKALRMDLLGTGVRVSSIDPGLVETEFSIVRFGGDRDRAAQVYRGLEPLTADDVAEAVVWMADRPKHVTAAQLVLLSSDQASATMVSRREG
ncbi:MAG TPA: SDR family NAD(P)-dependent oxidoreductase [Egibacteraceae bacterium]